MKTGFSKTNRSFTDVETGEKFDLFSHDSTHEFALISAGSKRFAEGTGVNGFYICTHCAVTVKINRQKQVHLPMGTFYNLKEGEKITHKKYVGFDKFQKV